jgi:hypothetical protein
LVFTSVPHEVFAFIGRLARPLLRFRIGWLLLGAGALGQGGCLLNNPVNQAPEVVISGPSGPVSFGENATFTATATDRDGDPVSVSWHTSAGSCSDELPPSPWPASDPTGPTFTSPPVAGPLCVWAVVRDSHGATATAHFALTPADDKPLAAVTLIAPTAPTSRATLFPLFTTFEVADASTDANHDKLTTTWKLEAPPNATATLVPCGTPPTHQCFVATVPGSYAVTVTATEDIGDRGPALAATSQPLTLTVDKDQPPCLREYTPVLLPNNVALHSALDNVRQFSARRVEDDGDPYEPPTGDSPRSPGAKGEPIFRWSIWNEDDGLRTVDPISYPSYQVPGARYQAGDRVAVRLEIRDRDTARMDALFAACGDEKDVCESTPGCTQRVTWHLVFDLSGGGGP